MINFIDIERGMSFDGTKPYIHYIGNGLSTNVYYTHNLIFMSDDSTDVNMTVGDDSCFTLIIPDADLRGSSIDDMTSSSVTLHSQATYNNKYVFTCTVVAISDIVGEVHDTIHITQSDNVTEIEIAGDFYGEDETLTIDLSNKGVEIPNQIQRAIYEPNVHDMSQDNILINRKHKELLMEYWNIIATKGSYGSLIRSKDFFEYGDLLKIEEYYNSIDNMNNRRLYAKDLELELFDDIYSSIDIAAKTTYIGLICAINGIVMQDGEVIYRDAYGDGGASRYDVIDEPIPEILDLSLKHTTEDMQLKMTLVGNYFSTFFMPLHLNLIHSTIESLIFSSTIKIQHGARMSRTDFFDNIGSFECSLATDNRFYLENETTRTYADTIARNYVDKFTDYVAGDGWKRVRIFGADLIDNDRLKGTVSEYDLKNFMMQTFTGVGVLVPVHCTLPTKNVIKRLQLLIHRSIDGGRTYEFYDKLDSSNAITMDDNNLDFNLLFTEHGMFHITIVFTQITSVELINSYIINICNDTRNEIKLCKIERNNTVSAFGSIDTLLSQDISFNKFMFTNSHITNGDTYTQWLRKNESLIDDTGCGLNHTIIMQLTDTTRDEDRVRIDIGKYVNNSISFEGVYNDDGTNIDVDVERAMSIISDACRNYFWKIERRYKDPQHYAQEIAGDEPDGEWFLIGVRKYFDVDTEVERDGMTEYSIENIFKRVYRTPDGDEHRITIDYCSETIDNIIIKSTLMFDTMETIDCSVTHGKSKGRFKVIADDNNIYGTKYMYTTKSRLNDDDMTLQLSYDVFGMHYDEVVTFSPRSSMGADYYKFRPEKTKMFMTIDESRFYPSFHRLVDLDNRHISKNDTVVCLPTYILQDKITDLDNKIFWEFVNRTTGEIFRSKELAKNKNIYIEEPFVGAFDYYNELTSGYYDVILHYYMDGRENVSEICSAFVVE